MKIIASFVLVGGVLLCMAASGGPYRVERADKDEYITAAPPAHRPCATLTLDVADLCIIDGDKKYVLEIKMREEKDAPFQLEWMEEPPWNGAWAKVVPDGSGAAVPHLTLREVEKCPCK
jgi:hypothetical protein